MEAGVFDKGVPACGGRGSELKRVEGEPGAENSDEGDGGGQITLGYPAVQARCSTTLFGFDSESG